MEPGPRGPEPEWQWPREMAEMVRRRWRGGLLTIVGAPPSRDFLGTADDVAVDASSVCATETPSACEIDAVGPLPPPGAWPVECGVASAFSFALSPC